MDLLLLHGLSSSTILTDVASPSLVNNIENDVVLLECAENCEGLVCYDW
jgi:hypothetical protein